MMFEAVCIPSEPDFFWVPTGQAQKQEADANTLSAGFRAAPWPKENQQFAAWVQNLSDARLELVHPIRVSVEIWEGVVTAWSDDLEEYGSGETQAEALDDLRAAIVETYNLLQDQGENKLGPLPLSQWRYLQTIIRET